MAAKDIIELSRRRGDGHIGKTLVRLATLAVAAHRYGSVVPPVSGLADDADGDGRHRGPMPKSFQHRTEAVGVHTEVDL